MLELFLHINIFRAAKTGPKKGIGNGEKSALKGRGGDKGNMVQQLKGLLGSIPTLSSAYLPIRNMVGEKERKKIGI